MADSQEEDTKDATLVTIPEVSEDLKAYPTGWKLAIIIGSLSFGTLLVAIDNTILAVAVPRITTVFNSLKDTGWYGSAYLLSITALQPTFGICYKYFDVKTTYLTSITIFEVGSVLCAAARNSPMFILGRAIAGVGAAGLFQGALGIVGYTVPLAKRPMYLSIVVSVFGLATCFGPVLGGVFTSKVSWRWCFYINVPIGVPVFVLVTLFLKLRGLESKDRLLPTKVKLQRMDLLGASILISAVCCLLLAVQWGGSTSPWRSAKIVGLFLGFGLLISLFIFIEWKAGEKATIPLRFLRQRSLLMTASYAFLIYASNYLDGYFLPFYFQAVQGASASESGVRFISLAISEMVAIVATGALVTKTGHYVPFMILSVLIGSIGTGLLSTIGLTTETARWAGYMVLTGIGIGIGVQLPYTAVQAISNENDSSITNAIVVFFSQLGGAITIPIGQTIFVSSLASANSKRSTGVSAQAIIHAGATNLNSLSADPSTIHALQDSYSEAVTDVLYFSVGALAIAMPLALFMEWKSMKKVSSEHVVSLEGGSSVELTSHSGQ